MNAGSIFRRITIILFVIVFITTGIPVKSEAQLERTKQEIDTYIKKFGGTDPQIQRYPFVFHFVTRCKGEWISSQFFFYR